MGIIEILSVTGRAGTGVIHMNDICIEAKTKEKRDNNSNNKVIDCQDVTANKADKINDGSNNFESIAICPTNYEIVDCNSFVTELEDCPTKLTKKDYVTLGGYYRGNKCVAVADNDHIRAQASCCRLEL